MNSCYNKINCLLYILLSLILTPAFAADTTYYEVWELNSLEEIGGHTLTVYGNPEVVETEIGPAIRFDGKNDQLMINTNPLGDAKEFTVEVIFKPYAAFSISKEPRFIHIQDPDDPDAKRVMMELRITADGQWYLDGFMNTDSENLTLIDDTKTHPTEVWQHAAITYKNSEFKTYVNGEEELSDNVGYNAEIVNTTGKTSIGARMNQRHYYAGLVKTLKITRAVLATEDFMKIPEGPVNSITDKAKNIQVKVYPNPAKDNLHISTWVEGQKIGKIQLFSVHGQEMDFTSAEVNGEYIRISTTGFPYGVYFLRVELEDGIVSEKFFVGR